MKPTPDLEEAFAASGVNVAAKDTVLYCNSGVSATYGMLALEIAGAENLRIYDGSWKEWGNDASKPKATGAEGRPPAGQVRYGASEVSLESAAPAANLRRVKANCGANGLQRRIGIRHLKFRMECAAQTRAHGTGSFIPASGIRPGGRPIARANADSSCEGGRSPGGHRAPVFDGDGPWSLCADHRLRRCHRLSGF